MGLQVLTDKLVLPSAQQTHNHILTRSRRLTVRTPGFHPGNRGSIPLGITNERTSPHGGVFSLVLLLWSRTGVQVALPESCP